MNVYKVGIVTKINNQNAIDAGKKIAEFFKSRNVKVFTVNDLNLVGVPTISPDELSNLDLDLVFSVGGDGTTLRTFRMLPNSTPVFSVNIGGTKGILAEVAGDSNIKAQLEAILNGNCFIDSRIRLQSRVENQVFGPALNDILIMRTNLTRTPVFKICLLNETLSFRMDGIIIATPTGSTGHSLSLGGPIMHEQLNCLMILPIAPVLRIPSIIIQPQGFSISCSHGTKIVIDGQEIYDANADSSIVISRYQHDGKFARLHKRGIKQIAQLGF